MTQETSVTVPEINPDEDPLYPTAKVAEILGLTAETIRDWISAKKIRGIKVNGYWRVPRSEVIRVANELHGD
jgi:excisionase family DNA binding protein